MYRPLLAVRATAEVLTGRRQIYYGWWILAASAMGLGIVNGTSFWAFGLFIQPLEDDFGWSRTDVSLGISVSLLVAGLTAPFIGQFVDRRGPRLCITIGAIGTAATYVLLATTGTLWQWYLYMALNGLARHLIFLIPFMALTSRWFDRRRSLAVGISGSGLMAGGMIMVPVMRLVIDHFDWYGAFLFVAGLTLVVYLPLAAFVIRDNPSDIGESPDGAPPRKDANGAVERVHHHGIPLRAAMRTTLFWALLAGLTLFTLAMATWVVHQVPIYESFGLSPNAAATIASVMAGVGIGTRLLAGQLADRVPRLEYGAAAMTMLAAVSMLVLVFNTSLIAIILFLGMFVMAFGGGGALMVTLLLTRAFGIAHFGAIMGVVMVVETFGLMIGPTAAGVIFDATGSYQGTIVMLLTAFSMSTVLFVLAARLWHPLQDR